MTAPKCTSWLGHKFEARFSKNASNGWPKFTTHSPAMAELLMDATRNVTYVHDVCVRCGHVVQPSVAS